MVILLYVGRKHGGNGISLPQGPGGLTIGKVLLRPKPSQAGNKSPFQKEREVKEIGHFSPTMKQRTETRAVYKIQKLLVNAKEGTSALCSVLEHCSQDCFPVTLTSTHCFLGAGEEKRKQRAR